MSEIKDYIHLYMGGEVELMEPYSDGMVTMEKGQRLKLTPDILVQVYDGNMKVILVLRPLIDITREEALQYANTYGIIPHDSMKVTIKPLVGADVHIELSLGDYCASLFPLSPYGNKPESLRYLLSVNFDIFNLIGKGVALSKTLK